MNVPLALHTPSVEISELSLFNPVVTLEDFKTMEHLIRIPKFQGELKNGITREISCGNSKVKLSIKHSNRGYYFQLSASGDIKWIEWRLVGRANRSYACFYDLCLTSESMTKATTSVYPAADTVDVPESVVHEYLLNDVLLIACFAKLVDTEAVPNQGEFSDVTVQTESKEYQLHKCIVCPQSPVLEALILEATIANHSNIAILGFEENIPVYWQD